MYLRELEQEINTIKQRNKRDELDKKWETRGTKKFYNFEYKLSHMG